MVSLPRVACLRPRVACLRKTRIGHFLKPAHQSQKSPSLPLTIRVTPLWKQAMTAPFLRCLGVDPYYFSLMDGVILPARFCEGLPPSLAVAYRHSLDRLRAGDYPGARDILVGLEQAAGGADIGLCAATLASLHAASGELDAAWAEAERALIRAPSCAEYRHLAGVLALRARIPALAATHFQQAVQLDPSLGAAWTAWALLLTLDGQWAAAEAPARRALALGCELGPHLIRYGLLFSTLLQGHPIASPFLLPPMGPLPEAALGRVLASLPAIQGDWPAPDAAPLIFVACDGRYLTEHALTLLLSLDASTANEPNQAVQVHLHLFNPEADGLRQLAAVAATLDRVVISRSFETVALGRFGSGPVYYSCARFCRFQQCLRATGRTGVLLDADCLFRRAPSHLPGWSDTAFDVGLVEKPEAPPWEQVLACGLLVAPSPAGRAFLERVAFFVGQNLIARKGLWFMDQIALFLAYRSLSSEARFHVWDERGLDVGHGEDAVIWTVGARKNQAGCYQNYKAALLGKGRFQDGMT